MGGKIVLALVVPLGLMALMAGLASLFRRQSLDPVARTARRRVIAMTAGCFVLVIVAPGVATWLGGSDVGLAVLPAVVGIIGVVAAGLTEYLWPRPTGARREALLSLRESGGRDRLLDWFRAGLVLSAAVLVVGALTAAADGRSVGRLWSLGAVAAGPYPGLAYALPVGAALGLLVAATAWALHRVDARPALGTERPELDRAVRAASRIRVLRFATSAALLTAAGLSLTMGTALTRLAINLRMGLPGAPAGRAPWDWTQNCGFALIGLGIVAVVLAVRAITWSAPAVPGSDVRVASARAAA